MKIMGEKKRRTTGIYLTKWLARSIRHVYHATPPSAEQMIAAPFS